MMFMIVSEEILMNMYSKSYSFQLEYEETNVSNLDIGISMKILCYVKTQQLTKYMHLFNNVYSQVIQNIEKLS